MVIVILSITVIVILPIIVIRHSHRDHHHDRHLNACKNSCTFFCAREDELEKMKEYITGPSQKVEKVISEDLEYEGNYLEEKKQISCKE